jgi:hypothetical protein
LLLRARAIGDIRPRDAMIAVEHVVLVTGDPDREVVAAITRHCQTRCIGFGRWNIRQCAAGYPTAVDLRRTAILTFDAISCLAWVAAFGELGFGPHVIGALEKHDMATI